jgi:DNA polymerase-3 subunit epsilon
MELERIKGLDPKRVVVLDTETTGLKPEPEGTDEILSLSIIDLDGTVLFDELVKPENRKRWPKAQEVHGITPAMVKDKKPLKAYGEQLRELWKNIDLVVGYNIEFDSNFIYEAGLCLTPYVTEFDVMREFAPIWGHWSDYHGDYRWAKLTQCAKHYHVDDFEAHGSLADAEATRQCFLALIDDPKYIELKEAKQKAQAEWREQQKANNEQAATASQDAKTNVRLSGCALLFIVLVIVFMLSMCTNSCNTLFSTSTSRKTNYRSRHHVPTYVVHSIDAYA